MEPFLPVFYLQTIMYVNPIFRWRIFPLFSIYCWVNLKIDEVHYVAWLLPILIQVVVELVL